MTCTLAPFLAALRAHEAAQQVYTALLDIPPHLVTRAAVKQAANRVTLAWLHLVDAKSANDEALLAQAAAYQPKANRRRLQVTA